MRHFIQSHHYFLCSRFPSRQNMINKLTLSRSAKFQNEAEFLTLHPAIFLVWQVPDRIFSMVPPNAKYMTPLFPQLKYL